MLREGDGAPDFALPSQDGKVVRLSDFRGRKVALYFYVRDFTPGCTSQAMSIRDDYSSLKKNRIAVLGISTDGVESHKKFAGKHELPFTILADEDAKVARTYGVYGMKVFMGRRYMGVKRTTFLIDADGRIVKIMPKVDVKNHAAEILEAFRAGRKGHP